MLVNSDIATVDELTSGRATSRPSGLEPPMSPADVAAAKRSERDFARTINEPPIFTAGDSVRAKRHGTSGHTRLPAYVRGRRGRIAAFHGAHVFPDANAHGEKRAEPLYTVGFDAAELWPEAETCRDRVFLNLWESYLERD
jgi:nitrile hydratase